MKTCLYCAEDIQDAAILCRYCGREQPSAPETESPEVSEAEILAELRRSMPAPHLERLATALQQIVFLKSIEQEAEGSEIGGSESDDIPERDLVPTFRVLDLPPRSTQIKRGFERVKTFLRRS